MNTIKSAYILAGGQSSRFGSNKAMVSVLGCPLIVRLANQLASDGFLVKAVAQKGMDYETLGIPTIVDLVPNSGPLAGVMAALYDCDKFGQEWCLILNCDVLDWRSEWQPALLSAIVDKPDASAVVLSSESESSADFLPFPGLYRIKLLETAKSYWDAGGRSMRGFHERIGPGRAKCKTEWAWQPKSFNTPEELARLLENNGTPR